jgi:hypothetical protein
MFVALDTRTGGRIVSLDPRQSENELRDSARSGILVCPECRQLIIFRAGSKRRHFAHMQHANCSLEHERPELVEARAVLYEWALAKFPDKVEIEHRPVDGATLPRPIDIIVALPGDCRGALWIFDAPMRQLETRRAIRNYFANSSSTSVTWLFLSGMRTTEPIHQGAVQISKMERDFIVRTEYDQSKPGSRGTLHYLDASARLLTTFRGLNRIHAPNIYAGDKYESDLAALLVHPKSFEIAHPNEPELLLEFHRQQKAERARQRNATLWVPPAMMTSSASMRQSTEIDRPTQNALFVRSEPVIARCRICGEMKSEGDLSEWIRSKGEGTCRSCMRRPR